MHGFRRGRIRRMVSLKTGADREPIRQYDFLYYHLQPLILGCLWKVSPPMALLLIDFTLNIYYCHTKQDKWIRHKL